MSDETFIHPKAHPGWILQEDGTWKAPIPYPDDGNTYVWNEETLSWELDT